VKSWSAECTKITSQLNTRISTCATRESRIDLDPDDQAYVGVTLKARKEKLLENDSNLR